MRAFRLKQVVTVAAVCTTSVVLAARQTGESLQPTDVVLRGGWLFDAVSDTVVRNTAIRVRNGTIVEVTALLESARGKLGPSGPEHADWWKGNLRARTSSP